MTLGKLAIAAVSSVTVGAIVYGAWHASEKHILPVVQRIIFPDPVKKGIHHIMENHLEEAVEISFDELKARGDKNPEELEKSRQKAIQLVTDRREGFMDGLNAGMDTAISEGAKSLSALLKPAAAISAALGAGALTLFAASRIRG